MTCTLIAQVTSADGIAAWYTEHHWGRRFDHAEAHPAAAFDDTQPASIPVSLRHRGPQLGHVLYLEHGYDGRDDLTAVAVLDDVDADQLDGLYASAEITSWVRDGTLIAERCRLDGLALVDETAGVSARAVRALPGDYRRTVDRNQWPICAIPAVLTRAARHVESRSAPSRPLRIHRPADVEQRAQPRQVEVRTLGRILSVS